MKIAIIGRTNTGKSTLINRLIDDKKAITADEVGTTRDTVLYNTIWNGVQLEFVDTGGFIKSSDKLDAFIANGIINAVKTSDKVLFLVDGSTGIFPEDKLLYKTIKNSAKKVIFVANKVDNKNYIMHNFRELGLGDPIFISALHGIGIGDLLDVLTTISSNSTDQSNLSIKNENPLPKLALIGRPNVGKSSLLNRIYGNKRVVVHNTAGTTRDSVSEIVQIGNGKYQLIDTAGLKKKLYKTQGSDYYANVRTKQIILTSDVCILLIDGSDEVSVQDLKLANFITEAGKGLIIIINKIDILDSYRNQVLKKEIEIVFKNYLSWVKFIRISALTGKNFFINNLEKAIIQCLDSLSNKISTNKLNHFIKEITKQKSHPVVNGNAVKIKYITQVSTNPVVFVLFANEKLKSNYIRFLIRSIREKFDFFGAPITLKVKITHKNK